MTIDPSKLARRKYTKADMNRAVRAALLDAEKVVRRNLDHTAWEIVSLIQSRADDVGMMARYGWRLKDFR